MYKHMRYALILTLIASMLFTITGCSQESNLPEEFTKMTDSQIQTVIDSYANYVTFPEDFKMKYELTLNYTVTDEDVRQGLIHALPNIVINNDITDRPCKDGDTVRIIYTGKIDGKSFPGGSTDELGTDIILGHSSFIDGFEDNIVGMNIGETKTFDITYPKSYGSSLLAGNTATFDVTLVKIFEKTLPELTDEIVQENSGYNTVNEITKACRDALEADATMNRNTELYNSVITYSIENGNFTNVPNDEIESYINQFNQTLDEYAAQYEMDKATAIKYLYDLDDAKEFDALIRKDAELYLKSKIITYALIKRYDIKIDEDEFKDYRTELLDKLSLQSVDDISAIYDDKTILYDYASSLLSDYVITHAEEK